MLGTLPSSCIDDDGQIHSEHLYVQNIGLKNGLHPFIYYACHYCHVKRVDSQKQDKPKSSNKSMDKRKGKTSDNLKGKTHD